MFLTKKKIAVPENGIPAEIAKWNAFVLLYFVFCFQTGAQPAQFSATATLDTNKIRIGEQARLRLTVTADSEGQIVFPAIADSIHKLEVVERSSIDTAISTDGKSVTYHQAITLTGFDSGFYVVEPFIFFYKKTGALITDSASTEALLLQVETVPVDTTKNIRDIKPPMDVPFTFREALPYLVAAVLAIVLSILVFRLIKNRKLRPVVVTRKAPLRPAHEIAIEELKKIEGQKLWQQGFYKQYQSAVSDTIRAYIENRFSILAMEMPSDDTLSHFNGSLISQEAIEKLRSILQSADMVKFAKAIPVGTENELSMQQAFEFVNLTKPVTQQDVQAAVQENEKEVIS